MTAQPDIFLSCNREDAGVVKRYADAFAAEGGASPVAAPRRDSGDDSPPLPR